MKQNKIKTRDTHLKEFIHPFKEYFFPEKGWNFGSSFFGSSCLVAFAASCRSKEPSKMSRIVSIAAFFEKKKNHFSSEWLMKQQYLLCFLRRSIYIWTKNELPLRLTRRALWTRPCRRLPTATVNRSLVFGPRGWNWWRLILLRFSIQPSTYSTEGVELWFRLYWSFLNWEQR